MNGARMFALPGNKALLLSHAFIDLWNIYHKPKINDPIRPPIGLIRWSRLIAMTLRKTIRSVHHIYRPLNLREKIIITNAYFIPDPPQSRFIRSGRAGVKIHVMLPWQSNHIINDWVARQRFRQYLERGIRLYGYQSR